MPKSRVAASKKSLTGDYSEKDLCLCAEIEENLKISAAHYRKWREAAEEDIKFALGDQWDPDDKAILENQRRPVITFNKIKPIINLVAGHMIQSNARIQVAPEGGEDEIFSKVADRIIAHVEKRSNLPWKQALQFAGGMRAGKGWLEFDVDYDQDPIFGELQCRYLGPFAVWTDPESKEYDLSDAEYAFKIRRISKARLKQRFPKKEKDIDAIGQDPFKEILNYGMAGSDFEEGDENDYGNDSRMSKRGLGNVFHPNGKPTGDHQKITAVEYWHRKYVTKWDVYNTASGSLKRFAKEEQAFEERRRVEAEYFTKGEAPPEFVIRESRVPEMQMAVRAGNVILAEGKSPFEPLYSGYPFFCFLAEYAPDAREEEYRVQSIVRSLKDPQREVNKARSQFLHIINTSANSGWIGEEDALSDNEWTKLESFGAKAGIIVKKRPGKELQRIEPTGAPISQQVRERLATDDFKEVSGINADLLAVDSSANPSGRAISLRIRQAITILEPAFSNYRYTKRLMGEFIFKLIPSLFDTAKLEKVLGTKFMQETRVTRAHVNAFLVRVEDGKYDVSIAEFGDTRTLREETFERMMTMVEKGFPIPPEVILEFINLPNKEEILNRIREYEARQLALAQSVQAGKGKNA